MRKHLLLAGVVSLALAGMWSKAVRAEDTGKEESEVKVSIKDVPDAVRATLKREAAGAEIKTVDMEKIDGKTVYEADAVIDGDNYEIIVSTKGKLISKKLDTEDTEKAAAKSEGSKSSAKADEEDEKPAKKAKKGSGNEEKDEK